MIKIKLVVPRKGYIKDAFKRFEEFEQLEERENQNDHMPKIELEEVIVAADKIPQLEMDADVIISRGLMTKLLKERNEFMPIVDIPVQGIDLIRCLSDCKERFGKRKVAVIGALNMIYGVESLADIVDLPIQSYILEDIEKSAALVDLAASEGCEIVVSGLSTTEYAKKLGLGTAIVETGKESFRQALMEAKRLALVSLREQEKAQRYQTILNHAYEGIIAIDLRGKISVFSKAAREMLVIPEENLIGCSITEVLQKGKFRDLLLSEGEYREEIVSYQSVQLSVKKVGIFLKGNKVGNMVAFQDVTGIQEMEGKIRKKIYSRGHVAKYTFADILFGSTAIEKTIETAKRYSEVDSNILIIGETGTGKEIFAQSIHNHSKRKSNPFVAINCAALPEDLLESELFGYAEGAFTGAMKGGKQGFFELAHRGTIFLDEIGEVSPKLQSRLLRVLQEREIMRIGDDRIIPVDVRIIAATNKNLINMVKSGGFRADLYYRLSVLDLKLPPLRARREDIPMLADAFIQKMLPMIGGKVMTEAASRKLSEANWEGNVRQLQNFCERLTVLCRGKVIDVCDIEKHLPETQGKEDIQVKSPLSGMVQASAISEREQVVQVLRSCHYNKGKAAAELGMSRTTLWRKMKRWNIEIE
ncbi:sigma-54-dependent Fis family transcriptional regulator [Bacillus badius]|uniref:Response regulator of zinc sigma-54-dependent two-component system n=1 Tax=Bacillus badius TaxID=1455 RepID=A0ABR5AXC5_BACBA|nr:sigma-54-dependent Fis family transcriptional regulator [Bacillus badius]KIL79401.1 Response regulator of zinc sigma-54-dependent two-component system [Bacillus badius]MED4716579.1 sigma-54-dependent Fis family transcriptional regulator [Bacillus badius]